MTYYELLLPSGDALDLRTIPTDTLYSVASSRKPSERIWNPGALQKDAILAAERYALSFLASEAVERKLSFRAGAGVEVVRVTNGGKARSTVGRAEAFLASGDFGYATVETRERGIRLVLLPSIVETAGERRYSAPVEVAKTLAVRVAEGYEEAAALDSLAEETGRTADFLRLLARHGIAVASRDAERVRSGREPVVSIAL